MTIPIGEALDPRCQEHVEHPTTVENLLYFGMEIGKCHILVGHCGHLIENRPKLLILSSPRAADP